MSLVPRISALVLAGASGSEKDRLAEYTHRTCKALIPIGGKPMVTYVVAALSGSRYIRDIVLVGLDEPLNIESPVPIDYVPSAASMVDSFLVGVQHILELRPEAEAIVASSGDIPLITSDIVDAFVATCLESGDDICYSVVERSVMERRFPTSRRSYARLREGAFAGGDLSFLRPSALQANLDLVRVLAGERKSVWKQARVFGPRLLALYLLGRLSLAHAEARASKALGIRGRVVIFPYAEIGMDVDKPFQLEIARAELEARCA